MEWLLGIFAWLGAVAAILTIGWQLDSGMDANAAVKQRLGQSLLHGSRTGSPDWLQSLNQSFLNLFDRVYGGRWNLLEQVIWCGLLASPVAVAALFWADKFFGDPYEPINPKIPRSHSIAA